MTNFADADRHLASLLELMQAASYSHEPYDLAERVVTSLGDQFDTVASALWLYAPPQHVCLFAHNLAESAIHEQLDHTFATGTALFSEIAGHAGAQQSTLMLSVFPLAVEQMTIGALAVVTLAPLDHAARLLFQALAGYLAARLQATQSNSLVERSQLELVASNHGWNEFIGHAAHEIKNPLASVKGYADLLLRRTSDASTDPFRKGLTIISQQTARATELLSRMSDTARLDSERFVLDRRRLNLLELARRTVQEQADTATHHHISFEAEDTPLYGNFDPLRLGQVLEAMISNAIKFSPHDSQVVVRLRQIAGEDGPEALLSVADHGVGVPAGEQGEVFERFKRGSNIRGQYGGLGLGLFAAREIVKRHGGRMWLESEPGRTTCFAALPIEAVP